MSLAIRAAKLRPVVLNLAGARQMGGSRIGDVWFDNVVVLPIEDLP